jgi:Fur family transcriptional regulator, stress-responsive regulator
MASTVSSTVAAELRQAGLRVTGPRIAVLVALHEQGHADVDELVRLSRAELGSLSNQAVYDMLRVFVAAGLVRRIEPAGHPALFETRTGDNHHHVVCRSCGLVADVDCAVGQRPCLTPSQAHGFVLDEAEVTFWGMCPRCAGDSGDDVSIEEEMA